MNTFNQKIYSMLAVLVIMTSGCGKDFLKIDPKTDVNADSYFKDENQINQAVSGAYVPMRDLTKSFTWIFLEMRSDNTAFQYNNKDRGSEQREFIDEFLVTAAAEQIGQLWSGAYTGISRCNDILAKIVPVEMDATKKDQYIGEAKFMRAYYYYNLVQLYGGVPLRLEPVNGPEDARSKGRATVAEVYEALESDLKDAAEKLPPKYSSDQAGRATKGAAKTLLAKLYMLKKDYKSAIPVLREVMTLGYDLLPQYADLFKPVNKNNQESIFEVQFLGSVPELASNFMYQFVPFTSGNIITKDPNNRILGGGAGWNIPTEDMLKAYEPGDKRKAISVSEGYTDENNVFVKVPYIRKYVNGFADAGRTDDNFPVLRFADVLLMLAECLNEEGYAANGEAFNLLNRVRHRADLADKKAVTVPDQAAFRLAIEQERQVELAFENHRWFDLVRTGRAVTVMNAHGKREKATKTYLPGNAYEVTDTKLLLPIPQREVNLDKLDQNTGY